jgi:cation:H+ antiporter
MLLYWLAVAGGVALLYIGGELLVRYATDLAQAFGVRPLIIGLTVIAFGTSAPELAASVVAAAAGAPGIAVGNVVGSNIANIGLILGLTVALAPLAAENQFVRREVPFMVLAGVLLVPFVLTGVLARWHALVMLAMMAVFMWWQLVQARAGGEPAATEGPSAAKAKLWASLGAIAGLVVLLAGAQGLVWGAKALASSFGVSERIIGLTVVAFGTSVPELASSLVAAYRRKAELVLGNIIGSNIFNTLFILPAAMLVRPIPASWADYGVDVQVMIAFSVLLMLFFLASRRLARWEGVVLMLGYCAYVGYLANQTAG